MFNNLLFVFLINVLNYLDQFDILDFSVNVIGLLSICCPFVLNDLCSEQYNNV